MKEKKGNLGLFQIEAKCNFNKQKKGWRKGGEKKESCFIKEDKIISNFNLLREEMWKTESKFNICHKNTLICFQQPKQPISQTKKESRLPLQLIHLKINNPKIQDNKHKIRSQHLM